MKRHLLTSAAVALAAMTTSVSSATAAKFPTPRFAQEVKVPQLRKLKANFNASNFNASQSVAASVASLRSATTEPSMIIPKQNDLSLLMAPDGSIWYAAITYDSEKKPLEGGLTYDTVLKGFDVTIYNDEFKEVGKVRDTYDLQGNEIRIADIQLDVAITQKFFNSDANYELMVCVFATSADYQMNSHTLVYQVTKNLADGKQTEPIYQFEGYVVDADNYAIDSFSENYLVTIMTTNTPNPDDYTDYEDFLKAYANKLTTYKKVGYGTTGPQAVSEILIPHTQLPGDGMNVPYFMLSRTADNKPAFVVNQYEKPYFVNQLGDDYSVTPDNNLVIDIYTMTSATASKANLTWTSKIPMEAPAKGYMSRYYSIGNLNFSDDAILPALGTGNPEYLLTVAEYTESDPDNGIYSFYRVDHEGKKLATFMERTTSYTVLSAAKNENPEAMFTTEGDDGFVFRIFDLETGKNVANIPEKIDDNQLTTNFDRVKKGNKVYYVSRLFNHEVKDGCNYEKVIWVTPDGKNDHIDWLNTGDKELVDNATINIDGTILNPYLFDTDDDMEYMVLIKRNNDLGDSSSKEVLLICDPESEPILTVAPDDTYGALSSMGVSNDNALVIVFYNGENYSSQFFSLPLTKFAGGTGTVTDPYLIASIADLQQISENPAAHYEVVKDIDAAGFEFNTIEEFSGTLNGNGYAINNLEFAANKTLGIFKSATTATISNLTLNNPVVDLSSASTSASAVLVAEAATCKISNIKVTGAIAIGAEYDSEFGVIAGSITNNTTITNCQVINANINLPEAFNIGGIAGSIKTGASVKVSSFSGNLVGGSSVGGILGDGHTNFVVANCHVDANITAQHTVGGVVGYASARGEISNNVVEGTITATTPRWKGAALGGVLGYLVEVATSNHDADGNPIIPEGTPKVVTNNLVAVSAITVGELQNQPSYDNEYTTAHRIVGYTSANFSEPYTDPGMENNYVVGNLAVVEAAIAAEGTTTEGANIEGKELTTSFLNGIGYNFGETTDAPWVASESNVPYLYFELPFILSNEIINVGVGETFTITLKVRGNTEISVEDLGFTLDYTESLLESTNMTYENQVLTLTFTTLAEGEADITIGMLSESAKVKVNISEEFSAIDSVSAEKAAAISYDGNTVNCPAAQLAVFNLSGVQVAQGYETVAVDNLASGVYVVMAVSANNKTVAKITVK